MDDIPDFHVDNADPALIKGDPGDAFQQFVLELFLDDRPQLRRYLGAGKDGGIDLSEPSAGTLKVMECKYMGSGDLAEALKRWKVTAGNLQRNLGGPDGPPKGQGQYQPWYEPYPAIVEYLFVINQPLKTEDHRNTLRKEIQAVFDQLSNLSHLSHLDGIRIDIVDGGDLRSRLLRNEHVLFRWFPAARYISGLTELDAGERRGFRIYLYHEKLPHYSLADHISAFPPPAGEGIEDELENFDRLERNDCVGLVISGGGGVGKTRLTLELGRIARDRSWVVFKVADRFHLDEVERRVRPEKPILFVFDYLETQRDSAVLLESIISRNRDEGRRMHFVASCRTSYLRSVRQLADLHYVDLSPRTYSPSQSWLDGYRRAAVRAILAQGNIGATEEALRTCQDIPVLAVFLCYLKDDGRDADLDELLGEENFGRWVAKRVQLSFGKVNIDIDLSALISLFPMPADRVAQLKADTEAPIFNILAQDGWIECGGTVDVTPATAKASATDGTWEVLHHVLADQILTQYFADNEYIAGAQAARLLQRAGELGLTRSCLESFQRVREESPLQNLPWEDLLSAAIAAFPDAWKATREEVIRTSLLDEAAQIRLLGTQPRLWEGAETQLNMHYSLGHLARWAIGDGAEADESARAVLESWIERAAPHADESNFVLTYGLRLAPERFRSVALRWLKRHPLEVQTHYLLVAWLRSGLVADDIREFVISWLSSYATHLKASYVYRAWLDAEGAPALVEAGIGRWLEKHETAMEAGFVYRAWLDAKGTPALVGGRIERWLEKHETAMEARFVYRAWLDAEGAQALVEAGIGRWLEKHETAMEARFVYRAWLDAEGAPALVEGGIRRWLEKHETALEASYVYRGWLAAKGAPALVEGGIRRWLEKHETALEASYVYRAWLDAEGAQALVEAGIGRWLEKHETAMEARFVYRAWLHAGGPFEPIRLWVLKWLHLNRECEDAEYLIKEIAKQHDLPIESVRDILIWCGNFPSNSDCLWRLTGLGPSVLKSDVEKEFWVAAESAIANRMVQDDIPDHTTCLQIIILFSYLISLARRNMDYRDCVDRLLVRWLRHPAAYGDDVDSVVTTQRTAYVQQVVDLIKVGELDLDADRAALERFFKWVNTWQSDRKAQLHRMITWMRHNYVADDLWDLIEFPPPEANGQGPPA